MQYKHNHWPELGCEEHYTNIRQEADGPEKCYTNTDSISNPKQSNVDKPTVNYFLPGPNQGNGKRVSTVLTKQLK